MPEKLSVAPWEVPFPTSAGEVKNGAKDMEEIAERVTTIFGEKILIVKSYSGSGTLKSGELAKQTKSGETLTLPTAATANEYIGVYCGLASTKVKTTGGQEIVGDFVNGTTEITLSAHQHVLLQSDGTQWQIIAGEPQRTASYSARTERPVGEEHEASAARPVQVQIDFELGPTTGSGAGAQLYVNSVLVQEFFQQKTASGTDSNVRLGTSFKIYAAQSWELRSVTEAAKTLHSSYLIE